MSEKRSMDEIQKEYGQVCALIGEKNFRIEVLKAEVQQAYAKAFELGREFASVQVAAAPEPVPSVVISEQQATAAPISDEVLTNADANQSNSAAA